MFTITMTQLVRSTDLAVEDVTEILIQSCFFSS